MTPDTLRSHILAAYPDAEVEVRDTTGGGDHYAAVVVTPAFAGHGLIDRHRMIYAALGDAMRQEIHALSLTTETPAERQARRNKP
jgi:stress-induced morphogen